MERKNNLIINYNFMNYEIDIYSKIYRTLFLFTKKNQ